MLNLTQWSYELSLTISAQILLASVLCLDSQAVRKRILAMSMSPRITQDPMYQLLRAEKIEEFNKLKAQGKSCDLTSCDFRGLDLREMDVRGLDLSNAYFRGADLRSIDFRGTKMSGVSLADAKVSGCFFPEDISAQEILMSVTHGTRIRQPSP